MSGDGANAVAFERVVACKPQRQGVCQVTEVLGGADRVLLHAGPPFASVRQVPAPVMNSMCIGAVYEGWATDARHACRLIGDGDIRIDAAQDHDIVVPLAGIVSPSMQLMVVSDANQPCRRKYSVFNEGMQHCTRLGVYDPALPSHLTWLNQTFSSWVASCLTEPLAVLPLIERALAEGDDCHARTMAGSTMVAEALRGRSGTAVPEDIDGFLRESPAFALNLWMATCSLMMAAAEGVAGSTLVTRAGGNGVEFGVRVAARPGHWITIAAPAISGKVEEAHRGRQALGAVGDSAVVDFMGLGGQVLVTAEQTVENLRSYLPADALQRPEKVLAGRILGFGNRLGVTDAEFAVTNISSPMILLGMIEASGKAGRIGGGIVDVPPEFFGKVVRGAKS